MRKIISRGKAVIVYIFRQNMTSIFFFWILMDQDYVYPPKQNKIKVISVTSNEHISPTLPCIAQISPPYTINGP